MQEGLSFERLAELGGGYNTITKEYFWHCVCCKGPATHFIHYRHPKVTRQVSSCDASKCQETAIAAATALPKETLPALIPETAQK